MQHVWSTLLWPICQKVIVLFWMNELECIFSSSSNYILIDLHLPAFQVKCLTGHYNVCVQQWCGRVLLSRLWLVTSSHCVALYSFLLVKCCGNGSSAVWTIWRDMSSRSSLASISKAFISCTALDVTFHLYNEHQKECRKIGGKKIPTKLNCI